MRKVIYSMMVSLDGFIEDVNHSLDWHIIDEELHQFVNDQQSNIDTYLYGRRLYENMAAYWPTADVDPKQPGFVLEFARIWKEMPKIVFSRTLSDVAWNSRLVREDIPGVMRNLKAQAGKDFAVGGAGLAASFMQLNLIDEYQLYLHPVIVGGGTPFFPPLEQKIDLKLVDTHPFRSGVILLRYQRAQ